MFHLFIDDKVCQNSQLPKLEKCLLDTYFKFITREDASIFFVVGQGLCMNCKTNINILLV